MPYELSFTARVPAKPREQYINDCCVGGDAVIDRLLPVIRERYTGIDAGEEDWGWFIWFQAGRVKLAVDVFTDDPEAGEFRVHLTSRRKRRFFGQAIADTPELEDLRELVVRVLERGFGTPVHVERVDEK